MLALSSAVQYGAVRATPCQTVAPVHFKWSANTRSPMHIGQSSICKPINSIPQQLRGYNHNWSPNPRHIVRHYSTSTPPNKEDKEREEAKSIIAKIKDVLHHYWYGSKLLVLNIKTTAKICRRVLQGHSMTRRERRLLIRTTGDLFRLVPFAIIVIVPFMELALPILLKLFPEILPSTFTSKLKKEEDMMKKVKAKIEIAKFLHDTIEEMAQVKTLEKDAAAFDVFMKKVRSGDPVSEPEVLSVCKLFKDDFTIDNLNRAQLAAMCKYMGINPYGTNLFLRFQLRKKIQDLLTDDKMIQKEGVDELTTDELKSACIARGMKVDAPPDVLRRKLQSWLDLHLKEQVPASLLILSRALMITGPEVEPGAALKETLSSLPEEVVEEVEVKLEEMTTGTAPPELKIEVLKHQTELLEEEIKDEKDTEEDLVEQKAHEEHVPKSEVILEEKIVDISEAVTELVTPMKKEREELAELKAEHKEFKEELKSEAPAVQPDQQFAPKVEDKTAVKLASQLDDYIEKLEQEAAKVQENVASTLSMMDTDKDGKISTSELATAVELLKDKPSDEELQKVVSRLDTDHDGVITVKEMEERIKKEEKDEELK